MCDLIHNFKAARRVSVPLVAVSTPDPAATVSALIAAMKDKAPILDTKDPKYRAVTRVRSRATSYWKSMTTPYPEAGIRLLRRSKVVEFTQNLEILKAELKSAAAELQEHYDELRTRAREELGDLYNAGDYPTRIDEEFSLDWDFPAIEPPKYLKQLHPDLYEQECGRVKARFDEAVRLTEEAMTQQLQKLVSHLVEKLRGDIDGKPKAFKASSVENLNAFFEQFRNLDLGSSGQLQALVDQAQSAVKGFSPDDLKDNAALRTQVVSQLGDVATTLDALMVNKPKRAIDLSDDDRRRSPAGRPARLDADVGFLVRREWPEGAGGGELQHPPPGVRQRRGHQDPSPAGIHRAGDQATQRHHPIEGTEMTPEIVVTISPDAQVSVEAQNVKGSGCQALTRAIEAALGQTSGDVKKSEFFQQGTQTEKANAAR